MKLPARPAGPGPAPLLGTAGLPDELLWQVLDTADIGLLVTDAQRRILYVNETFTRETGYSLAEAQGRTCRFLQGPATDPADILAMRTALDRGEPFSRVVLNYRKDGTALHYRLRVRPLREDGQVRYFVGVQEDFTETYQAQRQLEHWVYIDGLTGLGNRRAFDEALAGSLARREPMRLVLIDLNDFKRINDERGHLAGDALLCEVARCLARQIPLPGTTYRLGGDEFAALLPPSLAPLESTLEAELAGLDGGCLRAAVGGAAFPDEATEAAALFRLADERLYARKPTRKRERLPQ
ncbi:diguanylate cyclase [Deinococcus sp. MIMF12]|uniref:Diguanylate cyclase n=1 Tax=Deinococcus rhizophilus TaxID=3049544 RepID=A0ABT7JLI3_9DEIO|nr:diguanylate cyclase [Deinococcus rhizophilus]MDL2345318.1 diguanylate cyclase [Deinococcus rhizophilus]